MWCNWVEIVVSYSLFSFFSLIQKHTHPLFILVTILVFSPFNFAELNRRSKTFCHIKQSKTKQKRNEITKSFLLLLTSSSSNKTFEKKEMWRQWCCWSHCIMNLFRIPVILFFCEPGRERKMIINYIANSRSNRKIFWTNEKSHHWFFCFDLQWKPAIKKTAMN